MKYSGDQVLETMGEYAKNRNDSIYLLISRAFRLDEGSKTSRTILEFGAGKGEFIDRFADRSNLKTYASEIDPVYLKLLKKKHAVVSDINHSEQKFNYIFAIDVLEHINNDFEYIGKLFSTLKKNGKLFVYVPARPELYSSFDKSIGHYRRYLLNELKEKANRAGFVVESVYYHDFLGYFAAVFNKFTTDGGLNPRMVALYDKVFFPISMIIEKLVHPPIGKSLVLIAKKL